MSAIDFLTVVTFTLNLSLEDYKANVWRDDLLPSSQMDKMLENHPQENELRAYLQQEGAPMLDE